MDVNNRIQIGDLVLIHGQVAQVALVNDRELFYTNEAREVIRYSFEAMIIQGEPKRIWILEQ
jgi:hypothetical protein